MASFRLRYLNHNLELNAGDFYIGRSPECQLAVDDPLVSRKHAQLTVTADTVTVRDLGSRNGILVNGIKMIGPRILIEGDRVTVGSQEITLLVMRSSRLPEVGQWASRIGVQTLSAMVAAASTEGTGEKAEKQEHTATRQESTRRLESLVLLGSLAEKALSLGRNDEAERLLGPMFLQALHQIQAGINLPPDTVDQIAKLAARLSGATAKTNWFDFVVRLYLEVGRPCPSPVVDELHGAVRKVKAIDLTSLRAYVEMLQRDLATYGPAERFAVQRIEGLERLAALRS